MEPEKFSTSALYWLCKEAENRSSAVDSPSPAAVEEGVPMPEETVPTVEKRRRGRPPKGESAKKRGKVKKKEDEDEDVCFICFDGGSLVLCDRGDCPKAYHPACIKRDEAFFQTNARWTCGWHICSKCEKSVSRYMCYTCTYSLCKGCTKDADYLCIRGNKGLCSTCYRVVMMIENIGQENKDMVQVDFDDKLSWEYLFKVYWICLKKDLSLTIDEITRAQRPCITPNKVTKREKASTVNYLDKKRNTARENPILPNQEISNTSVKSICDINNTSIATTSCATKELLDFVAHVRNGDMSVLSQTEVQALLFDYVKINNLRDPQQRSEIICDSKLENLFKKPRVRHFEMLSLLEFHFLKKDDPRKYEIKNYISHHVGPVTGESYSDTVNLPMICENSKEKVNMKDEEITDVSMGNEGTGAFEKPEIHVESSESVNNGPIANSLSGSKSEAMVFSLSTGNMPSSSDKGRENLWHYRDPSGKVQGPFGIKHFHKWSLTGTFPPDMRIWRLNTEERDSILLVDVIKGQIGLHNNLSLSLQEVKNISADTSRHCEESSSGNLVSAAVNTDAHSNGKLEFDKGIEPVIRNDPQINSDAKIENPSNYLNQDPDRPKVISPRVHFTEKPREISKNEKWSKAGQIQISALNNENLSSQEKKASEATAGQCHIIQRNGQNISDQPSSDRPFCQNVSVKNWNFHKPDPQYSSMADLNAPSEQKLTTSFQDVPMPMPKAITEELQSQTIKPMANLNDDSEQKLTINFQDVPTPVPKTSTEELQSQTIKPMANLNEDSEQKFTINFQDVPMPVLKTSTEELQSQTIKPMANLNDDSKQKFTINFQDVPMPVPKTSTVELQPQTIKSKRKSSKTRTEKVKGKDMKRENSLQIKDQIRLQNNLSLSPQEGKNAFNSTFHHYDDPPNGNAKFVEIDTDANIKGKIELAMSNEPVGHISYSAAPVISNDPQINLDAKIGNSFKHLDPPKFINSYSDQPQVHSLEGSSTFTMKPHKDSVHEDRNLVSQTTGGQYHKSQINEKFYLDRPSLDQNNSVNNWNYHKFHPDNTLTAKPNDVSEQRFNINLQDFPMPMPKTSTEDLQSHTKLIDHDEKGHSRNQKTDHLINNYNKSQVTDNELSLSSNCHWNGGETYLPKEATKPSSKEWDSCFLSVSSFKPQAGENDHVTTSTSKSVEFPPPSPPNPVPNASSWLAMVTEPIEFNTLAEESVSDLLAEVDAMESNSDQASPNLLMDYADDLFQDSKTDCFSSLRGLSFSLDRGKNNEIDDTVLPPQSTMREEPILTQNDSVLDPLKKPPKHSSASSILKVETKRSDIPDNQSEFRSYRPNPSPKKKTRDLSEIMNGPTKHVKLKTHGLNRRESEERTPRGSSSKNRSTSSGRESHQKHVGERLTSPREQNHSSGGERLTSPREHNHSSGGEKLTSPRERNHSSGGEKLTSPRDRNAPGGDSGFSKGRSSWSRQSSIGSGIGGHSRSLSRGQRVCKFYESGYCRKGAFCEYLHP